MSGEEARVNVYCRFRPINKLERETWEKNRLGILLKLEELQNLEPQFHKKKNKKFLGNREMFKFFSSTFSFVEKNKSFLKSLSFFTKEKKKL